VDFREERSTYFDSSCLVGHSYAVEKVWHDIEYNPQEVKKMGWFNNKEKEEEVSGMRELQKSLRDQLDVLDDEMEEKQVEIEASRDEIANAIKEKDVLISEFESLADEKFRIEKALSALKTGKSAYNAARRNGQR
jgi:SMC interacting uncharacterized protein involved in chromosome segregation